jgi:archaemetzincin
MKKTIVLIRIGRVDNSKLRSLKNDLDAKFNEFNIDVDILKKKIKLGKINWDSNKKQYKAQIILDNLLNLAKEKEFFRVLGILNKDIYSKDFNFNFGVASRGSLAALISITRLKEEFYSKSSVMHRKFESVNVFRERILKEATHELGHTFGLKHCHSGCVMQFSESLIDIDKKSVEFCESCLNTIRDFLTNL